MPKQQQSSIDRLPEDIRTQLQELLRDPRVTQLDATRRINAILEDVDPALQLSKSAVNRYVQKMEAVGSHLRESREMARMWIGELGAEPAGETGRLLNEIVRNLAFRAALRAAEGEEVIDPKEIKNLAIAVHRLEQAAERNAKVEEQIRAAERDRIAGELDKAAKGKDGRLLDAATVKSIREQLNL